MENTPSKKPRALPKSMNMGIWVIGIIRSSYTQIKFSNSFFVVHPFCIPHSICLSIGFGRDSSVWKCCVFNHSSLN